VKVYVLLMVVAAALTVLLTPLVRWACLKWGIVPKLRSRDIQAAPIPRLGGIAITIALVITMLISARIPYMAPLFETNTAWAVVGGACAMCALGVVDDVVELDWMTKLSGQILIAGSMAFNGVQLVSFPIFGLTIGSSRLSLMLTVLLIVGIMNAVNFIDGLDGLAAGAGIFVFVSYTFISYFQLLQSCWGDTVNISACYTTRDPLSLAIFCTSLVGALAGFLWWNASPAQIFMGDTGSQAIGAALAGVSILTDTEFLAVLIGGLYVLTTLSDVIQISVFKMTHKRVFRMAPLHHHFELKGWKEITIVIRFWLIAALFAVMGAGLFYAEWVSRL